MSSSNIGFWSGIITHWKTHILIASPQLARQEQQFRACQKAAQTKLPV